MIQLTENKVAISPLRDPGMSASGKLYIPDIAKERCDQGIVKYIGPKVIDVHPGDHVLFGAYDGTLVVIEGEGELIVMREPFIKCRFINHPDSSVPGLFFRAKPDKDVKERLEELVSSNIENDITKEELWSAINAYIVDQYFPATYEMSVDLISQFWSNDPYSKEIRSKKFARQETLIEENDDD